MIGKLTDIILLAQHFLPSSHMAVVGPSIIVLSTPGPPEWSHDLDLTDLNILFSAAAMG